MNNSSGGSCQIIPLCYRGKKPLCVPTCQLISILVTSLQKHRKAIEQGRLPVPMRVNSTDIGRVHMLPGQLRITRNQTGPIGQYDMDKVYMNSVIEKLIGHFCSSQKSGPGLKNFREYKMVLQSALYRSK